MQSLVSLNAASIKQAVVSLMEAPSLSLLNQCLKLSWVFYLRHHAITQSPIVPPLLALGSSYFSPKGIDWCLHVYPKQKVTSKPFGEQRA